MGFFSDSTNKIFIDHFSVFPLECKEDEELDGTIYEAPFCNRFVSHFEKEFELLWKSHSLSENFGSA